MNYQDEKILRNSYYNGSELSSMDLDLILDSEDFIEFIRQGNDTFRYKIENGGVLVITGKQVILSYNLAKGQKTHNATLSKIYELIHNVKYQNVLKKQKDLRDRLCNKYLHARIYAEVTDSHHSCMRMIAFTLKNRTKISKEEYDNFIAFYDEYAWIIKKENFVVWFNTTETDIDSLKLFFEKIVDENFHLDDENEVIIATSEKRIK